MTVQYFVLFFLLFYQQLQFAICFYLAIFRNGLPTNKQTHHLNRNAIASLSNDDITQEKVEINTTTTAHYIFGTN